MVLSQLRCMRLLSQSRQGKPMYSLDMTPQSAMRCSWEDFQAYVDEREPKMLRAFTSLEVNSDGQYDLKHIKSTAPTLSA